MLSFVLQDEPFVYKIGLFDLSFEGTFVAGLLGGNLIGVVVGALLGVVALLYWEWGALPLYVVLGLFSGMLRNLCYRKEEIWNFSPFVFLNHRFFAKEYL